MEKLFTMIDICKEAGVSEGSVYGYMRDGKLPPCDFQSSNRRYWREDSYRLAVQFFKERIKWSRDTKGTEHGE